MSVPRFRFAPSPTGTPHIGNLHTALFSWALARHMGGDFILRVEDSDSERNTPGTVQAMLEALTWLGLDWDEGPDVGGEFGPYIQSQRLPKHQKAMQTLLENGQAYYDDGRALRLKMPTSGQTVLQDAIRGPIVFENETLKDPVIARSDGTPLYHLAAMVDDHDMGITHVVRGEDWITSTPIHIQIYKAMGWPEPVWIHLPLTLNKQGQKLKKRDPEGGYLISDFQEAGYLPQAVFNYLMLLGWSPANAQEIVSKWDVRQMFGIERLSASPSIFDWEKLKWVNRQYLQRLEDKALAEMVKPFLEDVYDSLPLSEQWLVQLTAVTRSELNKLEDIVPLTEWAFGEIVALSAEALEALNTPATHPVIVRLIVEIAQVVLLDSFTAQTILKGVQTAFKQSHAWDGRTVFHPIRAAITGQISGPPLADMMSILGKERVLRRLAKSLQKQPDPAC